MPVFKRTYKDRHGKKQVTPHFYVEFKIDGRRVYRALRGITSKREAERIEAKMRAAMYDGSYDEMEQQRQKEQNTVPRLRDFIESDFLPYAKAHTRTWFGSYQIIKRCFLDAFGNMRLDEITAAQIEDYQRARAKTQTRRGGAPKPATVNREISALSRVLSLAVKKDLMPLNPCSKVEKLSVNNQRVRYLSADEESRLMKATEGNPTLQAMIILALNTGMRRGEILKLRWENVDLARGVLHIRETKNGYDRIIPLNTKVKNLLENLSREIDFVFFNAKTKKPIIDFQYEWELARERAKLSDFHFHDLRHTAATRLADAGETMTTIAAILGHRKIQMTMRYAHAIDSTMKQAVEKLIQA